MAPFLASSISVLLAKGCHVGCHVDDVERGERGREGEGGRGGAEREGATGAREHGRRLM